jgi:glycosyltransferase involved in cell wall biosynthesis
MRLLVIARLLDVKVRDKLIPLLRNELVDHVTLVRHAWVSLHSEKLTQVIHDSGMVEGVLKQKRSAQLKNTWLCFYNGLRVAQREHPHVIVAYNLVPYGLVAWLVARLTGAKIIVSLIGSDFNLHVRLHWFGGLLRAILRNCDRVTIFGEDARASLIGYGLSPDRVFVLPNTADTDTYKPDLTVTPDVDLIYVGNLAPLKRVDLVLDTLHKIHESRPETTLLIVGDGDERDNLKSLAQSLGISHVVTFHGWTAQVVPLLRRARIFAFFSQYEGLPMAMVEAMCTGLPVVVADVGALNTVVRDGENGYLLPSPADPVCASEHILHLLRDADHYQQLREQALTVRQTHGYERTQEVWRNILESLV